MKTKSINKEERMVNKNMEDNFLSEEELAIFNAYVDDYMDSLAFGNSDWVEIYKKITQGRMSAKSKKRISMSLPGLIENVCIKVEYL